MKTLVISLERIKERRNYILEHSKEHGLDFVLIDAVDGTLLPDTEIVQMLDVDELKKYDWILKKGEIGCVLSHRKAYQYIIDNNLKSALIIEDDVVLPANINEIIRDIDHSLLENEVVLLYYGSFKPCRLSTVGKTDLHTNASLVYPIELTLSTTVAYIISNTAAKNMLNTNKPILVPADRWWYFYHKECFSSIRVLYPSPLKIMNFKSTIDYLDKKSLKSTVSHFINKYKIPLLFQISTYLRTKRQDKILNQFRLTDEVSPIYQELKK